MNRASYYVLLLLLATTVGYSQDTASIEKGLVQSHSRIQNPGGDSVGTYDDMFLDELLEYTSKYPQTLNMHFAALKKSVDVYTSDDGLFRIYSWDNMQGGTMRYFDNVFQYSSGSKVRSSLLPHRDTTTDDPADIHYAYTKLFTFRAGAVTYYLAVYVNIWSTLDFSAGIKAFSIQNGVLNDTIRVFKTASGMHNQISYNYQNRESGVDHSIYFDKANNSVNIPLVDDVTITENYITYRFTGKYFERVGRK